MLGSVSKVCRFIAGTIVLATLLQYGLPRDAILAIVAPDRHLSHPAAFASATHDPLTPCTGHEGTPAACCFGSGCAVTAAALAPSLLPTLGARSIPGYAMPAGERGGGIAGIPGLHPPRRAA